MVGVVELDDGIVDSETFVAEVVGMELRVEEFVGSVIKIEELRAPLEDLVCVDMGVVVDEFAQEIIGDVDIDIEDSEAVVAEVVEIELLVAEFVGSVIKTEKLRASIEDSVVMGADVDEFV